jgi:hypothetical protein
MTKRRLLAGAAAFALTVAAAPLPLARLAKTGTVDERFQGYNIDMVEVTGAHFWAPYGGPKDEAYRQRPPIDLTDPKLVALARNLGPSLLRVSGTWANNTYLLAEGETLTAPPAGFSQILIRDQWRKVVAFSKAVDAPIVTSFAASGGTRDANGVWTTDQAQRIVDLTKSAGGTFYAAEFFNEPNIPGTTAGMPTASDVSDYAADFRIFRNWARKTLPETEILGAGGASEGTLMRSSPAIIRGDKFLPSDAMLGANPGTLDAVSYHFYSNVTPRFGRPASLDKARVDALPSAWIDGTLIDADFYDVLRDKHEPGKPLLNTETAQAACDGSPWASPFLDSFRYLNQIGALAQRGVKVVLHNTLAASDYGLLDPDTLTPRPNYWAAVMWKRTMGSSVLAPPASPSPALRLYAHCLAGKPGGVGLVALNTGSAVQSLTLRQIALVWSLAGQSIETRRITINGTEPGIDTLGTLTGLDGARLTGAWAIGFAAIPGANNAFCR